jgi:predicted secreted protein
MNMLLILVFLVVFSPAFAETYVDAMAEVRVPIEDGQEESAPTAIQAATGMNFVIILDANATTGYEWQLARPIDEMAIKFIGSEYFTDNPGLIGSGGKSVWTFEALKPGKTKVFFKYVRPWEKDDPTAKKSVFIVNIKK